MSRLNLNIDTNIAVDSLQNNNKRKEKLFSKGYVIEVFYESSLVEGKIVNPGMIRVLPVGFGGQPIFAYPIDESFTCLPLVNEIVEVFLISKTPYYRRVTIKGDSINTSAIIENGQTQKRNFSLKSGPETNPTPNTDLNLYKQNTISTNALPESNSDLGLLFKKENIHRLKMYEGDTLIQSRFGQSIRLSAYNNVSNTSSPTIIIRNRESIKTKESSENISVLEDINNDGSIIEIGSGKYISNFIPGVLDASKKSNFTLKVWENSEKYAFENYPKKLDGDQVIITSDRLILSSRVKEIMIFSKSNLGLVTDSVFTLDSEKGMSFVSHNGDVQFEANNKETKFFVGKKGKIFLGIDKDDPAYALANGKALVEAIGELIDEIIKLAKTGGILTPAGPSSGMNPVNEQALKKIMSKLPGILSKKVFIGM